MKTTHVFSYPRRRKSFLPGLAILAGISAFIAAGLLAQSAETPATRSPVPRAPPAPVIAPPPASPISPFLPGPPDTLRFERARPQIEVWRTGSDVSQRPRRRGSEVGHVLIAGDAPFVMVLHFDRMLAGKVLDVMWDENTTVESAPALQIDRNGQVVLSARLNPAREHGRIAFLIDGITTVVNLDRASVSAVASQENKNGVGGTGQ